MRSLSREHFPPEYEHINQEILEKLTLIEHSENNALDAISVFLYRTPEQSKAIFKYLKKKAKESLAELKTKIGNKQLFKLL